jgi:hypothetical protein
MFCKNTDGVPQRYEILFWNVHKCIKNPQCVALPNNHLNNLFNVGMNTLTFSPDGKVFAIITIDGILHLYGVP